MGIDFQLRTAVILTFAVMISLAVAPARAEFWDQKACVAEGNTADVCACTKKLIDDRLAARFKPEILAAFDEKGMPGVEGLISLEEQMALAGVLIDVMTTKAPEACHYRDDPAIN